MFWNVLFFQTVSWSNIAFIIWDNVVYNRQVIKIIYYAIIFTTIIIYYAILYLQQLFTIKRFDKNNFIFSITNEICNKN